MADYLDILLSRYRFLKTPEKLLLRDVCGSHKALSMLSVRDIEAITGRKHRIDSNSLDLFDKDARKAEKILASEGIKCLFFEQANYPAQLAEIYNPPYALYYRGNLPDWNMPAVGIVGTRMASGSGLDAAFSLGFDFGSRGIPVVSGLALGIDSAAHRGCCESGGVTIAVLGCGPERVYPASNREIAAKIIGGGGAVVSEYLPGEEPRKHHFPERNRLISGLSRAVVVVDAPGKSGALITADFALEQGRDLYIHRAGYRAAGSHQRLDRMVFDGAPLIESASQVFDDWGVVVKSESHGYLRPERITNAQAGTAMAEMLSEELDGRNIKFNGIYYRRACS